MNLSNPTHSEFFPDGHRSRLVARYALAALLLMMLLGLAPLSVASKDATLTGEGSGFRQLIYIAIFLGFVASCRIHKNIGELNVIPISALVAISWCWISVFWAIDPGVALRRLLLTSIVIWIVFKAVQLGGIDETLRTLRSILLLTLLLNYAAIALLPSAVHQILEVGGDQNLIGNWRGLLPQKNFAGAVCAVTICLYIFDARHISKSLRLVVIVAAAFFLYKSQSKTSMGLLGVAVIFGFAFRIYNPRYKVLVIPISIIVILLIYVLSQIYWDSVLQLFADDDAFTGRIQIWPVLIKYIEDNWWLGAGFGSFWNIGDRSPVFQYASSKNWITSLGNGHNGFLDLTSQIGFPGVILCCTAFMLIPIWKIFMSDSLRRSHGSLLFALMLFLIMHNFTESSFMDRDAIVQVILMVVVALVESYNMPEHVT